MSNTLRSHLRRRRMQRWIRREARLLAREAEAFDCDAVRREADKLLAVTGSVGSLWTLRTA